MYKIKFMFRLVKQSCNDRLKKWSRYMYMHKIAGKQSSGEE